MSCRVPTLRWVRAGRSGCMRRGAPAPAGRQRSRGTYRWSWSKKEAREKKQRGEERGSEKQGRWRTGVEQERRERARPSNAQPSPSAAHRPHRHVRPPAVSSRAVGAVRRARTWPRARAVPRRCRRAYVAGPERGGPRCTAAALEAPSRGGGPGRLLEVEKCSRSWGGCGGRGASAVASITGGRCPPPGG